MVARENQNVIGVVLIDKRNVLVDCVCCSFIPIRLLISLVRGKYGEPSSRSVKIPRRAVSDILVKRERLILGENTYGINSRIDAVRKRKIDNFVLSSK